MKGLLPTLKHYHTVSCRVKLFIDGMEEQKMKPAKI
jgi:hypothetical protein